MAIDLNPARRRLALFASCLAAIGIAVAFVDRPVSTWSHAVLRGFPLFNELTHIVDPLMPAAAAVLAVAGLTAAFSRWRPGETGLTLIACCLSEEVAYAIKEQLKWAFGRTWPETWTNGNPSWIANGAYGFHFFHGGEGWASFPSGHMTMISAVAAVLWVRARGWRWLWAALVALVAVGLVGSDYHFVGDMIAGTCLGSGCAAGVLALLAHVAEGGRKSGPAGAGAGARRSCGRPGGGPAPPRGGGRAGGGVARRGFGPGSRWGRRGAAWRPGGGPTPVRIEVDGARLPGPILPSAAARGQPPARRSQSSASWKTVWLPPG